MFTIHSSELLSIMDISIIISIQLEVVEFDGMVAIQMEEILTDSKIPATGTYI